MSRTIAEQLVDINAAKAAMKTLIGQTSAIDSGTSTNILSELSQKLSRIPKTGIDLYKYFFTGQTVGAYFDVYGPISTSGNIVPFVQATQDSLSFRFPEAAVVYSLPQTPYCNYSFPEATAFASGFTWDNADGSSLLVPKVAAIPAECFMGAYELGLVSADTAVSIGDRAFANIQGGLGAIYVPAVTTIGASAFSGSHLYSDFVFESAVNVGASAFAAVQTDEPIRLPLATNIASDAFSGGAIIGGNVYLGSRTVAQVAAADYYGADTEVVFVCSDGTTARPMPD